MSLVPVLFPLITTGLPISKSLLAVVHEQANKMSVIATPVTTCVVTQVVVDVLIVILGAVNTKFVPSANVLVLTM